MNAASISVLAVVAAASALAAWRVFKKGAPCECGGACGACGGGCRCGDREEPRRQSGLEAG